MTPHPYPFPQVLLDDLAPLCNATFMYRWSWRRDTNNAAFGCPRSCAFAAKFMAAASHVEDFRAPQRFDRRAGAPLTQLPSRLFDPLWLRQNGRNRAGRPDAIPGTSEINAALRPMPFFELTTNRVDRGGVRVARPPTISAGFLERFRIP